MRGHHLGVEDLTRGDEGVPVCASMMAASRNLSRADFAAIETAQMGTADHRLSALPGMGCRRGRYWLLDRLLWPLLPQHSHAHDRICLLAR